MVTSACGPVIVGLDDDTGTTSTSPTSTSDGGGQDETYDDGTSHDEHWVDLGGTPLCAVDGTCTMLDLLLVVDDSGTMGEEQLALARSLPRLVDELEALYDHDGDPLWHNVNVMVTTTDFGHPLCTPFQKPGYEPRQGAPVSGGCNSRIERFTGLDPMDPVVFEQACTEGCPVDIAPSEHFIHFDEYGSNVPGDDVRGALACVVPQGIDGCGYESPLETMLRAIDEDACWNRPDQPHCDDTEWADAERGFLREGATLAVVVVTDELDCSVQVPDGYSYFTDEPIHWNTNPSTGVAQASSAVCFNAGVSCTDADGDGTYESCTASDHGVLHPVERYVSYLEYLVEQGKDVVMLGIVGVPEVVGHQPDPPYAPTVGGVADLVYRQWIDLPFPAGDIPSGAWGEGIRAADEIFELGALAPGCVGLEHGDIADRALPPVRLRQVCESLDGVDEETGEPQVRCCLESVCDNDYGPAFRCLAGMFAAAESSDG